MDALAEDIRKFIAHARSGHDVSMDIIVGPATLEAEGANWRIVVCTHADGEVHFNSIGGDDRELVEELRTYLINALIAEGGPLVVHDVDDDLTLVAMAEALWPSDKTRKLHAVVQAERSATYH